MRPRPRKVTRIRRPPAPHEPSPALPRNCFGQLVGTCEKIAAGSRYRNVPDDNHVYLWLRTATGPHAGLYECAVNLAAPLRWGGFSALLVCEREEECPRTELPPDGFHPEARCSYEAMGLRDADFTEHTQLQLAETIRAYATASLRVAVYGVTYGNGEGMHDIHLNSHETPLSTHRDRLDSAGQPTQDGALVFYVSGEGEMLRRRWLLTKFITQRLG
jgi:hypothetical protein